MAVAAAGAQLASGVFGMMSANYQAEIAKMNQKVAQQNAVAAQQRGGVEAQMQDFQNAQVIGEQTAQQAASGVSVSGADQVRTRNMARLYAGIDRARITDNAAMESHNYKVDAANFKAQAASSRLSGVASMVGGALGAAAELGQTQTVQSLLGGASGAGSAAQSAAIPKPTARPPGVGVAPIPRPRPIMPSIGRPTRINPLLQSKYMTGML